MTARGRGIWLTSDDDRIRSVLRELREQGEALGFGSVFAGPLVRSSYRADEQRHAAESGRGAVAY